MTICDKCKTKLDVRNRFKIELTRLGTESSRQNGILLFPEMELCELCEKMVVAELRNVMNKFLDTTKFINKLSCEEE